MNNNKHFSEETRKKMSDAAKNAWTTGIRNRHLSEETKLKIINANKGKHRSEDVKLKMSEAQKKRWKLRITNRRFSEEHKRKIKDAINCTEVKCKMLKNTKEHQNAILEEIIRLQQEGYRTLNGDLKPRPDIIAFRDGKIIAIEVEFGKIRPEKYDKTTFFDDIIWIKKQHKL